MVDGCWIEGEEGELGEGGYVGEGRERKHSRGSFCLFGKGFWSFEKGGEGSDGEREGLGWGCS